MSEFTEGSENAFQALLKSAVGFVVYRLRVDPDLPDSAVVEFVSPSLTEVMGIPADTPFPHWFDNIDPEYVELVRQASERASVDQVSMDVTFRTWHGVSSEWRWVHAVSHPVIDPQSGRTHFNGMMIDVTPQKVAELRERELQHSLEQAQKLEAISLLAGGIAHDFNNLLTVIGGKASLLYSAVQQNKNDLALAYAEGIETHVAHAATLTNQLLGYTRQGAYEVRTIDLAEVLRDTIGSLQHTRKDVVFNHNLDEPLWISADLIQIERVLMNVIANAFDAMPDGGEIQIEVHDRTQNEHLVSFTDSGVGMDKPTLDKIFEPFFTTKQERGTGLGLSASKGILEALGGDISVTSQIGAGTTFTLTIPRAQAATGEAALHASTPVQETKRILVVDDEQLVRETLLEMLQQIGHQVVAASTAEEAVEQAAANTFDVMLLDMIMPGLSGSDLGQHLQEQQRVHQGRITPYLICSGYASDERMQRALNSGACGFVRKPVRLEELAASLDAIRLS